MKNTKKQQPKSQEIKFEGKSIEYRELIDKISTEIINWQLVA